MKKAILPVAALLCGVALGWFFAGRAPAPAPDGAASAEKKHRHLRVEDKDGASTEALRARLRKLEKELADARENARAAALSATNLVARAGNRRRHGPDGFRDHVEEMRKNDPARYAQMTNHMAQMRARGLQRTLNRLERLAAIDVSHMSAAEKQTHERLQELLAHQEELREQVSPETMENLSDADRKAHFEEMMKTGREIRELERAERDTLLTQTANVLGFKGDDAADVVATIKSIYEATESHGGRGGGPGGPPPPGN